MYMIVLVENETPTKGETMTTTKIKTSQSEATLTALLADHSVASEGTISRRGNSHRTIALIPRTSAHFCRFVTSKQQADEGITAVIYIESLGPHPDALSVTGKYLHATDSHAPSGHTIGYRNAAHLMRDDGAVWKRMYEAGW